MSPVERSLRDQDDAMETGGAGSNAEYRLLAGDGVAGSCGDVAQEMVVVT